MGRHTTYSFDRAGMATPTAERLERMTDDELVARFVGAGDER